MGEACVVCPLTGCWVPLQMVEMASAKFVCIVDESKLVSGLGGSKDAMPVEIVQFCHKYTLNRLQVGGCCGGRWCRGG